MICCLDLYNRHEGTVGLALASMLQAGGREVPEPLYLLPDTV